MKRTMYEAARHTPKRGVGGSNPLMDASEQRRKPLFSRVFGFYFCQKREKRKSRSFSLTFFRLLMEFMTDVVRLSGVRLANE